MWCCWWHQTTCLKQVRHLQQKWGQVYWRYSWSKSVPQGWSDHLSYRDLPGQDLHWASIHFSYTLYNILVWVVELQNATSASPANREGGDTNMTRHTPEDKLSTRSTEHSNVHICCGIFDLLNVIAGHDVQRTGFEGGVTTTLWQDMTGNLPTTWPSVLKITLDNA